MNSQKFTQLVTNGKHLIFFLLSPLAMDNTYILVWQHGSVLIVQKPKTQKIR